MGVATEVWAEVPMIEFPSLLKLMVTEPGAAAEEQDEAVVLHCWRRCGGEAAMNPEVLSIEELLWLDAVEALAETEACAEDSVPARRLRLADEGLAVGREELLTEAVRPEGGGPIPPEDAPRLASLAFLQQYIPPEVLRAEVLPHLLPESAGRGGFVRVFSTSLSDPTCTAAGAAAAAAAPAWTAPQPATLDDLFAEDLDFRVPPPWAALASPAAAQGGGGDHGEADPLTRHELTSVALVNERSGFALAFHCLQEAEDS